MERRAVIQILGLSALALGGLTACSTPAATTTAGATTAGGAPTPARTTAATGAGVRIPVADVPVGGGAIRAADQVVVTQATAGQFKAFSAVCTHQGCVLDAIRGNDIVCPCHGSRFSIVDGSIVKGPATKPLVPARSVTTQGTDLVVVL